MKTAKELYDSDYAGSWCNYQPMLNAFGNIVLQIEEDNYQGSSWLIYEDNGRYGYLTFGWGSCSGCDALQACCTLKEVQELMDHIYASIQWFESLESLQTWFRNRDWEGMHEWHLSEFKSFYKCVLKLKKNDEYPNNRKMVYSC
jgi:hypothetical protein